MHLLLCECPNFSQKVNNLPLCLRQKFADHPVLSEGVVVSFKRPHGESVVFTFKENAIMRVCSTISKRSIVHSIFFLQDLYQFVALHTAPPFVFCLPHPHKQLPLSEVLYEPAKAYNNHASSCGGD